MGSVDKEKTRERERKKDSSSAERERHRTNLIHSYTRAEEAKMQERKISRFCSTFFALVRVIFFCVFYASLCFAAYALGSHFSLSLSLWLPSSMAFFVSLARASLVTQTDAIVRHVIDAIARKEEKAMTLVNVR